MSDMENTAADGREVERAVGERNGVAVGRDVRAGVPDRGYCHITPAGDNRQWATRRDRRSPW